MTSKRRKVIFRRRKNVCRALIVTGEELRLHSDLNRLRKRRKIENKSEIVRKKTAKLK